MGKFFDTEKIKGLPVITFVHNWNNKLRCRSFTTIRLASDKYMPSELYRIDFKTEFVGVAMIVTIKAIKLAQINEWMARIDSGYSREQCIHLITTFYRNKVRDWNNQPLYYILLTMVANATDISNSSGRKE
jgi:hypothetical protein